MRKTNIMPKISVVTICRNAEQLIAETMKSVLSQSYKNIEYIVIEGKSRDKTLDIIHSTAKDYPDRSIKIVSEPDEGIADAMNKGVRLATGDVIAHLHAGDRYIDNNVIEEVMKSYQENAWRWGVAGSIVVDHAGNERHIYKANPDYRTLLKKNCIPHQSTFLVKDIFDKHGLFKVEYKQAMDYEYWLRITFKGGERFTLLPFNTTYFLNGGKSSNIFELLKYLRMLRSSMHEYGCDVTVLDDFVFLSRVMAFYVFNELKKKLSML
ncbi:MAG: putative glycosyltransferase [candidate division WS2 bacterium]|nr:putative glycosyltransferase [Candidatus Lithacetigena glycinireducens]MBT9174845.1 putative glycosyltransferase [Candidatus Lithacetigena glycinireducens]